nr:AI-2E family transporter [Phycisphaerae bacterium]
MARPDLAPGMPRLITLAAVAIVTLALYLGKDVLMPLALGILFSFLLAPLVTRLERTGLGRIPAVALVTVLS